MTTNRLYEVWLISRRPPVLEARFRRYDDALRYISRIQDKGAHDIRFPDGSWNSRRQRASSATAVPETVTRRLAREAAEESTPPPSSAPRR